MVNPTTCELCQASEFTEWFYSDDECWIAECESCVTPMVVWRVHSPHPSAEIKASLHKKLADVIETQFDFVHRVDDNMRSIPDHYHAHARPKNGFYGHNLKRKS